MTALVDVEREVRAAAIGPRQSSAAAAAERPQAPVSLLVCAQLRLSAPSFLGAATHQRKQRPVTLAAPAASLKGPLEDVRRLGAADLHGVPARLADDEVRHAAHASRFA